MTPASRHLTAFTSYEGLYEFKRMPFGLCNAPSTFQRLMELVLRGLNWKTCLIYMDDVIIFSPTFELHLTRLEAILLKFREAQLTLKPSKCKFARRSVEFLGHIVSSDGIQPNPAKVELVKSFVPPKNPKQVKQFTGLCGYYRRFIPNFASIASPLYHLLRKNVPFLWTPDCQTAFETLKHHLINPPILAFPDFTKEFHLTTDASGYAIGQILSQFADDIDHVIAYAGRTLTKAERNYTVTELEALAVIDGVKHFSSYLYGQQFTIHTDHSSLQWLFTTKDLRGRAARWALTLQGFNFNIKHKPGKFNQNADALSRLQPSPDDEQNITQENPASADTTSTPPSPPEAQSSLPPLESQPQEPTPPTPITTPPLHPTIPSDYTTSLPLVNPASPPVIAACSTPAYDPMHIYNHQRRDPELLQLILYLKDKTPYTIDVHPELASPNVLDFFLDTNGILQKHIHHPAKPYDPTHLLVVPKSMRKDIILSCHDSGLAGHFGIDRTYQKVKLRYYWPGLFSQVQDWCKTCEPCLKRKRAYGQKAAPLQPISIGMPWDRVAVDVLGPLPLTRKGNRYILLFSDYRTKWPEAACLPSTESQQIAQHFFDLIITRHGSPHTLLSDRGSNFLSKLMREIYAIMNVHKVNTSPYHPATDGLVERLNGTLTQALSMYTNANQSDWDLYVQGIIFGYRTSVHAATNETPFFMLYGRHARLPLDVSLIAPSNLKVDDSSYCSTLVKNLAMAQTIASDHNDRHQARMKTSYDKRTSPTGFKIGQQVLIHDPTRKKGLSKKLSPHYTGPYTLVEQKSPVHFKVSGFKDKRSAEHIHVNRMKPFPPPSPTSLRHDDTESPADPLPHSTNLPLPPTPSLDATKPLLDTPTPNPPTTDSPTPIILKHRRRNRKLEYLVKNVDEPDPTAKWVTSESLSNHPCVTRYLHSTSEYPMTRAKARTLTRPSVHAMGVAQPPTTINVGPPPTSRLFHPPSNVHSPRSITALTTLLALALLFLSLSSPTTAAPALGLLYNCDLTQYVGAYALPIPLTCDHTFASKLTTSYEAEVRQYSPDVTHITLYLCRASTVTLTCWENFFTSKDRTFQSQPLPVTSRHCHRVARTKRHPTYGKLYPSGLQKWTSQLEKNYDCKWMKTRRVTFPSFTLQMYTATLQGIDTHLHQAVTHTVCQYKDHACIPRELPKAIIVWGVSNHTFSLFQLLGTHLIKQIHNFVLIPKLAIGGSIIDSSEGFLLLDIGYQIIRPHNPNATASPTFRRDRNRYVTTTKFSRQQIMNDARITQAFLAEGDILAYLAKTMCQANMEIRQFQRWLLSSFPDTSSEYLFPEFGKLVQQRDEALIVHQCKAIADYTILWNMTLNSSCYHTYPVLSPHLPTPYFLEVAKRRVVSQARKIPCTSRPNVSYITDRYGALWEFRPPASFTPVKQIKATPLKAHISLTKIAHFDLNLLHYARNPPSRVTLLDVMSANHQNLEDLRVLRDEGAGNLITGIGRMLGQAISSVASGGSQIIRALGKSIKDVLEGTGDLDKAVIGSLGNATSSLVDSTTTGLAKVLSALGGLGNIILWCLVILIYIYIIMMRFPNHPFQFLYPSHLRRDNQLPPPVPPRNYPHGRHLTPRPNAGHQPTTV